MLKFKSAVHDGDVYINDNYIEAMEVVCADSQYIYIFLMSKMTFKLHLDEVKQKLPWLFDTL